MLMVETNPREGAGNILFMPFSQQLTPISLSILEPPEMLPLSFGAAVMSEGDFAQVSCIVRRGDDPLSIAWSFHGSNITSDLGIVTTPIGGRGSMLVIPSVAHKHRGTYTCKASNMAGIRIETVELKVNGE